MDGESCRSALAASRDVPAGLRRRRPPPEPRRRASTTPRSPTSRSSPPTPCCAAIGETGLDYYRDYAPRADQERAFHAQIDLARATGKPLVIHTRAAEDDTIATLRARADGVDGDHALLLDARPARRVPGRGLVDLVRGERDVPEGAGPRRRPPSACPTTACSSRPTRPYLTPQVVRKERNQPAYVAHTATVRGRTKRRELRGARAGRRAQRGRAVRVVSALASPPTGDAPATCRRSRRCAGCARSASAPKRDLGQNFLIDSNILGVIERAAELDPADVVLEIGGGLGVLSEHLAPRCAHVHVVELDRALVPGARGRARAAPEHDACTSPTRWRSTSRALDPAPTKVVANLPYGIAAGAILRTIEDLDGVTRWVAMVQREVGERFAAAPGQRRLRRAVGARPARVRRPRPPRDRPDRSSTRCRTSTRCSSCSTAAAPRRRPRCARSSRPAFAHRRKALARSLALSPAFGGRRRARPRPRGARRARPSRRRPRRAAVARGLPRAVRRRCGDRRAARGRAGEAQPLPVPRAAPRPSDGRHELVTVFQPLTLADRVALEPAPLGAEADEVSCPGVAGTAGGEPRGGRAARLSRPNGLGRAAGPAAHRQANPGRRGHGGRLGRRRPPRSGSRPASPASTTTTCCATSPSGSAPTSRPRCARRATSRPARARCCGRSAARPSTTASLVLPADEPLATADVYRRADEMGLARDAADLAERLRAVEDARRRPARRPRRQRPRARRALRCARRSTPRSTPSAPPAPTARCCAGRGRRSSACSPRRRRPRGGRGASATARPRPVVATPWRSTATRVAAA